MALDRIENLIEKYFDGDTSIAEENELKVYFSSADVAQHLQQYQPVFGYFSQAKNQSFTQTLPLKPKKRIGAAWLSVAASVVVLLGIGTFLYTNEKPAAQGEFGTYDNPEQAMAETQKALTLVSQKINVGMGSMGYIKEYEQSRNKVFKK